MFFSFSFFLFFSRKKCNLVSGTSLVGPLGSTYIADMWGLSVTGRIHRKHAAESLHDDAVSGTENKLKRILV